MIVKNPMDLGTIHGKLGAGSYKSFSAFEADVQLIWDNAKLFNNPDSDVYEAAAQMEDIWTRKLSHLKKTAVKMQAAVSAAAQTASSKAAKRPAPTSRRTEPQSKKSRPKVDPRRNGRKGSIMPPMGQDDGDTDLMMSDAHAAIAARQVAVEELRAVSNPATPIPTPPPAPSIIPLREDALSLRARELEIERLKLRCQELEIQAKTELGKRMLEQGMAAQEIVETIGQIFPVL
jgi:hypothetical protein